MHSSLRKLADELPVTLDGLPAVVCGYRNDFATVRTLDGSRQAEYAWSTLERVLTNGGRFKT